MEYKLLENGQVIKIENINGHIIETHFCMVIETKKERMGNQYKTTTLRFNEELGKQEVISEDFEPVPKEVLLQELKEEYLPQIKDADLLGDIEEKQRLQQEYLQKKAEIENDAQ